MDRHQQASSAVIVLFLVVGALVLAVLVVRAIVKPSPVGTQRVEAVQRHQQVLNPEPITRAISQDSLPSSQDQARALLAMMAEAPGHVEYRVTYQAEGEATVVGCDLQRGVLVRVHQRASGKGSQEVWSGHIVERVSAATGGGTLNDTPDGKIPGTFESF